MAKRISTKREALRAARARRRIVNRLVTVAIIFIVVILIIISIISANKQGRTNIDRTPTDNGIQEFTPTVEIPTPGGSIPELVGTKLYFSAPPFLLDMTKQYTATVKMEKGGEFIIQLFPDKAPITVNSFVFLAREGFFNGVTFHRVLEGFMAQGGDPLGTGMGNPGYEFVNELNDLNFDKAGVVAMANAGQDTNGSQFFITFGPVGLSESDFTIFGQVISGMDVVNNLTLRDPAQNPSYNGDVIQSIVINEN